MRYEVKKVQFEDEFKNCPTCGYRDGFHSMYKRLNGDVRIFSICPSCHDVFDLNLSVKLTEKSDT